MLPHFVELKQANTTKQNEKKMIKTKDKREKGDCYIG